MRQRLRRACACLHSQFSIDGSCMSSIAAFIMNGLILCLATQTTTWKKALLYISLYKQTNLASLLSCLTLWSACFFSNIYCYLQMFNFNDQAAYDLSISLDGRFLAVNVTPNPCPRHVCLMFLTMLMTINEEFRRIGKHFANEGF